MQEQKINRYLKEIINTMNDGLMVVSPDGTILMVNQAFEKIMGYSREEIIGRPCTILKCDTCATARSGRQGPVVRPLRAWGSHPQTLPVHAQRWVLRAYPQKCRHPAGRRPGRSWARWKP